MELLRILAIPFHPASLLFVALTSLLLAILLPSLSAGSIVLASFGLWVVLVWLTRYAFRLIDDVANGARTAAVAEIEMVNPFGDPRCWVHPALALALIVMHVRHPHWPVAPTLVGMALLFPPSIMACVLSGRARDALDPIAVGRVVQGLGAWYLLVVLATAGSALVAVLLARSLGPGWALYASLELLLLVACACIGGVVWLRRNELGFAPRVSPERDTEAAVNERQARRQKWLDELFGTVRSHDTARALEQARQWLDAAAPHELPGDLQSLLDAGSGWNEPREFARMLRALLPLMVTRRQGAMALASFDAGVAAHPAFAPADESTAIALAEFAMQAGRRRTALQVLESYLAGGAAAGARLEKLRESLRSRAGGAF